MSKDKKLQISKSILQLRYPIEKFAKKHGIRIKGKNLSKGEKKRNKKRLFDSYCENAINGLDKAVKILVSTNKEGKKVNKVKEGVDNIITNPLVMKKISKLYNKNPDDYLNMIYLPHMIMNTIQYYQRDDLSEEEKQTGASLEVESLVEFCEKLLKKQIKKYKKFGLDQTTAYQIAVVAPSIKVFKNRGWYKKLIEALYNLASEGDLDLDLILNSIPKIDKKKSFNKKDFIRGFYEEVIFRRLSNKNNLFNESQKEFHSNLIEKSLEYLNGLKKNKCRDILRNYIKKRKTAEENKNDSKRIIKFIDQANSNSSYENLKNVITELIADNANNEIYLS